MYFFFFFNCYVKVYHPQFPVASCGSCQYSSGLLNWYCRNCIWCIYATNHVYIPNGECMVHRITVPKHPYSIWMNQSGTLNIVDCRAVTEGANIVDYTVAICRPDRQHRKWQNLLVSWGWRCHMLVLQNLFKTNYANLQNSVNPRPFPDKATIVWLTSCDKVHNCHVANRSVRQ